ncbi:hypothetical protein APHAL10511_001938 [Amanita phalloides]|nr:hypothetical protein APHAL10511_001938 [Amanita phalloides]
MTNFQGRNLYYLRLTKAAVLPLYVFLDEQHIKWMNDVILQRVLNDLRPYVLSSLKDTAKAGKAKIHTIQGDEYQFCYFFRNADHHSVLIKRRVYTAELSSNAEIKRKRKSRLRVVGVGLEDSERLKRQRREKQNKEVDQNSASGQGRMANTAECDDCEAGESSPHDLSTSVDPHIDTDEVMDIELDEDEKPKPKLRLIYEGPQLHSRCLCIVVEPLMKRVRSDSCGATALANAEVPSERQPLFLLEHDNDQVSNPSSTATTGLMTFSQQLHAMQSYTMGSVDDSEDTDGDVFLADADDAKEL